MATIKDVAERAGITVTTVSRVMNNRGYISEKTRQKVHAVMKELNYQPSELARGLSKEYTNIIGVIVPSLLHPFFSSSINYFEQYASQNGFKLMVCNSHHRRESELEYIDMLRSNKVAGIILCTRTGDLAKDIGASFPVVTFERAISDTIPAVFCDNYQGGLLATRHLLERGCKHPAIICGSVQVHLPADLRKEAFTDTCKEANVQGIVMETNESQFETRCYKKEIIQLLEQSPKTDGIFATSDVMAAQVIQQCTALGLRVPQDIKLVGFDDVELAGLTTPELTTIHQPVEQMCAYAIDAILRKLEGQTIPVKTVLPVHLVQRSST